MIDQHEYGYFTEANSSEVVIARNRNSIDERLKQIMAVITRKLHEAVIEIDGSGIVRGNGRRQHRDGNEEHQEQDANDSEGLVAKSARKGHRWPMIAYCSRLIR